MDVTCCLLCFAGEDGSNLVWHGDRDVCTYRRDQEDSCSCCITRQLIPMPDSHKPVQPSRTPLEAGTQLLRYWLNGIEGHKSELQHPELFQDDPYQADDEDGLAGSGPSHSRFAVMLDAEDYIRAAQDRAANKSGKGSAVQESVEFADATRSNRGSGVDSTLLLYSLFAQAMMCKCKCLCVVVLVCTGVHLL